MSRAAADAFMAIFGFRPVDERPVEGGSIVTYAGERVATPRKQRRPARKRAEREARRKRRKERK